MFFSAVHNGILPDPSCMISVTKDSDEHKREKERERNERGKEVLLFLVHILMQFSVIVIVKQCWINLANMSGMTY